MEDRAIPKCRSCGRLVTDGQHPGCFTTNPEPVGGWDNQRDEDES